MTRVLIVGGGVAGRSPPWRCNAPASTRPSTRPTPTTDADPAETLLAVARGHAVYCRRDLARVLLTLRIEFTGQDHPIGRTITELVNRLRANCTELITAGRRSGPPRPPPQDTASALLGTLESIAIELAGRAPSDTELAERAVRGLLGCRHSWAPTEMEIHE
jgi:hypothetical protein